MSEENHILSDLTIPPKRSALLALYPRVNARIIGPFLLAVIVAAGVGVFIVTQLMTGSIQERFNNQLLDSARSAANTITDIEREQLATLRLMVFTDGVADAIAADDRDSLDLWLRPIAANNRVDELILFDVDANPVLHLSRGEDRASVEYTVPDDAPELEQWEAVQRVLADDIDVMGDKFVEVVEDREGNPTFYINAPVVDAEGEVVGGAAIGLRNSTLVFRVSEQAIASITLNADDGSVWGNSFRGVDDEQLRLTSQRVNELMLEVTDFSPVEETEYNDIPYQVLYAPFTLRGQQLGVMSIGLTTLFIQDKTDNTRDILGVMFGAVFVVILFIGLVISRTITNPIERLVRTTRAIREGDLSQRVELTTPDELGELGASFDTMTDRLVRRNEEISELYEVQVQQTARREAMLTSISDVVIVQDIGGEIILRNSAAETLIDDLTQEASQQQEFQMLCDNPSELHEPRMVSFVDHHYSVLATPVEMASGDLLGYVIVFRDITALIESEKLKDELVLQMSHELRTPLAAVRGFVDLVKMLDANNLSEQSVDFIDKARDNLTSLEHLVNQVIDVSAMISNRFVIDLVEFDLTAMLNEVFAEWQAIMPNREHQLSLSVASESILIQGDERRLYEVMGHLLRNAYNYTLPGGLISIHAEATETDAIIAVQDNGVGIDADELERVFERMYRGRSADAGPTDARGMGLGLYIAQQIVELHGGHITLASEPEEGTRVTVRLPKQPPTPEQHV